jgi:3'(2'), 5'-bisphosphate nucleotidase
MTEYTEKQRREDLSNLPVLRAIAREAGKIIMGIYNDAAANTGVLGTEIKHDQSPVTEADKLSSGFIGSSLSRLTPFVPVVCEENSTEIDHKNTPAYWAVDPLDGTKEFIGRTGGFAVKIALLRHNQPVLATVFSPAYDTLYFTAEGQPAWKKTGAAPAIAMQTRKAPSRGHLTTLFNQTHADPAIYAARRAELTARGLHIPAMPDAVPQLPRNLRVAEGIADVHVVTGKDPSLQYSGGFVWDNATDYLLTKNAGGTIVRLTDGREMHFDIDPREKMTGYVTFGDKALARKVFPELSRS